MAKKLKFTYKDKEYVLEYNRKVVMNMQEAGFNIDDINIKPIKTVEILFSRAFFVNHRPLDENTKIEMWETMKNKDELIKTLVEMYAEPIKNTMIDKEDAEKNTPWSVEN